MKKKIYRKQEARLDLPFPNQMRPKRRFRASLYSMARNLRARKRAKIESNLYNLSVVYLESVSMKDLAKRLTLTVFATEATFHIWKLSYLIASKIRETYDVKW